MARLEMFDLYPSPWSERLRWTLEWKGLSYARRPYVPMTGEEELRRETGHSTAPVLLADGAVVGDSDAAVDWLEVRHPEPPLLPLDPAARARVRAWEVAATEALAPLGRIVMIGRYKAFGLQPFADYFAACRLTASSRSSRGCAWRSARSSGPNRDSRRCATGVTKPTAAIAVGA